MSIEVHCSWGFAEDVTIEVKDERFFMLLCSDPSKNGPAVHGYAEDGHICLTKEQARELAAGLLKAAAGADELDESYQEYCKKHGE